ncbi:VOC family protein [Corynebacterium comes]|uniref:3-demethylubiquinone-9 3-methyltransferase n=1 Tax=Corynebacterium comes TaxID=2675218 RepID=A0A6B8VXK8_9CORY|nr:VOC family protein [Corynebacterium comes]QGU04881.1 3-demethylubiquinone-9 3-methyltransferase [Corynebacterium comes]
MQTIIPHLWINRVGDDATDFYVSALPDTTVVQKWTYPPDDLLDFQREFGGQTLTVELDVAGYRLALINAGDEFTPTPAITFFLNFDPSQREDARGDLDRTWEKLCDGGQVLMDLGEYPFSPRYGWVQDKYGVSWQLMLTDPAGEPRPFVVPDLMFCGPVQNKAGEAVDFYLSVFPDAALGNRVHYDQPHGPATTDSVLFSEFQIRGEWLAAMDSAVEQPFTFTPGVSLLVNARGQEEIDRLWDALSAVPEAEQCGWLQDRYGVSWQIAPENLNELLERPGAFGRLMEMKKIVIDDL